MKRGEEQTSEETQKKEERRIEEEQGRNCFGPGARHSGRPVEVRSVPGHPDTPGYLVSPGASSVGEGRRRRGNVM